MTTPRSVRSTANHSPSEHLDDERTREQLRDILINKRRHLDVDTSMLSRTAGKYPGWIYNLERKSDSITWLFNSVNDWGRAVGLNIWVHPNLQPVLDWEHIGPLARMAVDKSDYSGIGFMEYCVAWRKQHEIEQRDIAKALDVNHGTMYAIEESVNSRISTMQKYIRALGGFLEFQVEPIKGWEYVPVTFD